MATVRDLPSVDRLIQAYRDDAGEWGTMSQELVREAARAAADEFRARIQAGALAGTAPGELLTLLIVAVGERIGAARRPSLREVINATGVIIQTNLGRAPLGTAAIYEMERVAASYSNLEYDLERGERGSRNVHLEGLLTKLSGAEAALAVNNNAAAIYLALIALAAGREVVVSRGQAVEIGGGFRIPDVLRQSGAALVEVGTTNRTYARDYAEAIGERTALLMRIHSSNFRLVGFVHEAGVAELAEVGRARGVPVLDDLGSGTLLDTRPYGLAHEPMVQESVAEGADLVTFSGDKLLGGPQAGLIVGRRELVERLRRHPLARAMRLDKVTIAGLEATLRSYLYGDPLKELPVWAMISAPLEPLRARAAALAAKLAEAGVAAEVSECRSAVGGGSLPGETLPSWGVAVAPEALGVDEAARLLRAQETPIVARIADGRLIFDLRTVEEDDDRLVYAGLLGLAARAGRA